MLTKFTVDTINLLTHFNNKGNNSPDYDILLSIYNRHGKQDPDSCMKQIRLDGSNKIMNFFDVECKSYDEIVYDVAKRFNIDDAESLYKNSNIEKIEHLLLNKITSEYINTLPKDKRKEAIDKINKYDFSEVLNMAMGNHLIIKYGQKMIQPGNKGPANIIMFTLTAMLLIGSMSGPDYKKIIPTVYSIALLRLKHNIGN